MVITHHLTHCRRVTYLCVSKVTINVSDNGLLPGCRQAIIWTNAGILLIGPLRTNFSEILIGIEIFSFRKMHFKMSSGKWLPLCRGLNVLTAYILLQISCITCWFCSTLGIYMYNIIKAMYIIDMKWWYIMPQIRNWYKTVPMTLSLIHLLCCYIGQHKYIKCQIMSD